MKIVVATGNEGKVREFKRILQPFNIEITTPKQLGIKFDVEETGKTFAENAYIKARAVADATGSMALADDSGVCVQALPDILGVYSARFCGEDAGYDIKIPKLLEMMKDIPDEKRTAWYECVICLVSPKKAEALYCFGKCYGKIGYETKGENGFGYDPIFYMGERSFAQFSPDEKDKLSHRGKALRELTEKLEDYLK